MCTVSVLLAGLAARWFSGLFGQANLADTVLTRPSGKNKKIKNKNKHIQTRIQTYLHTRISICYYCTTKSWLANGPLIDWERKTRRTCVAYPQQSVEFSSGWPSVVDACRTPARQRASMSTWDIIDNSTTECSRCTALH